MDLCHYCVFTSRTNWNESGRISAKPSGPLGDALQKADEKRIGIFINIFRWDEECPPMKNSESQKPLKPSPFRRIHRI